MIEEMFLQKCLVQKHRNEYRQIGKDVSNDRGNVSVEVSYISTQERMQKDRKGSIRQKINWQKQIANNYRQKKIGEYK